MAAKDQLGAVTSPYAGAIRAINNHGSPLGGDGGSPNGCNWKDTANCGPNDEIYGFHGNGANTLFCDGHVFFLVGDITPSVLRRLITSQEGIDPPSGIFPVFTGPGVSAT